MQVPPFDQPPLSGWRRLDARFRPQSNIRSANVNERNLDLA
jgi:hypothetical protein